MSDEHEEVCSKLAAIETMLSGISEDMRSQRDKIVRIESRVDEHHQMLYGSKSTLDDPGGLVGAVRQLRQLQVATLAFLLPLLASVVHSWVT